MMTNVSRILNEMTNYQADKNQIVQNLVDYPLLIIDDLGIERNSEFALEQIYNVIDSISSSFSSFSNSGTVKVMSVS